MLRMWKSPRARGGGRGPEASPQGAQRPYSLVWKRVIVTPEPPVVARWPYQRKHTPQASRKYFCSSPLVRRHLNEHSRTNSQHMVSGAHSNGTSSVKSLQGCENKPCSALHHLMPPTEQGVHSYVGGGDVGGVAGGTGGWHSREKQLYGTGIGSPPTTRRCGRQHVSECPVEEAGSFLHSEQFGAGTHGLQGRNSQCASIGQRHPPRGGGIIPGCGQADAGRRFPGTMRCGEWI